MFQLCLGTLLVGAGLADNAGLEEKLVTNQERFLKICKMLNDKKIGTRERLECIAPIVAATQLYQFVPESDLKLETMIGATRLAAKALLEHDKAVSQELKEHLERLTTARTDDNLQELKALQALDSILTTKPGLIETNYGKAVRDLVKVVWSYVSRYNFWINEFFSDKTQSASSQAEQGV